MFSIFELLLVHSTQTIRKKELQHVYYNELRPLSSVAEYLVPIQNTRVSLLSLLLHVLTKDQEFRNCYALILRIFMSKNENLVV